MIRGIGVDMTSISRIEKAMAHPRFEAKVLGEDERLETKQTPRHAAARWAAKEAVAKALGCGFAGFGLRDIQLLHHENGAPYIVLSGQALETACRIAGDLGSWWVSITHEGDFAIAMVVWENNSKL